MPVLTPLSQPLMTRLSGTLRPAGSVALGGRPDGIEDKNLYGTLVANERMEWDDLGLLIARASR